MPECGREPFGTLSSATVYSRMRRRKVRMGPVTVQTGLGCGLSPTKRRTVMAWLRSREDRTVPRDESP